MTENSTPPDTAVAVRHARWPGILSLIAGYLFGLTAVVVARITSGSGSAVLLKAALYLALCLVFIVLGLVKLGRARKSEGAAASTPRKVRSWMLLLVGLGAILPVSLTLFLPPGWRPQLDIRNTGAKPARVVLNERSYVIAPGQSWSLRFSTGDSLTVAAGEGPDNSPGRAVPLPKQNPKSWSFNPIAQRYHADVNADDPANIRVENLRYEEVASPPAPPEPWPQ